MNVSSPKWFTAYKPPVINYGPRTIFCVNNLKFKKSCTVILPKKQQKSLLRPLSKLVKYSRYSTTEDIIPTPYEP